MTMLPILYRQIVLYTISFWIISISWPAMNSPKSFSVYSCGPILTLFLLCDHRSGVVKDCCSYHSSRSCTGGRWSRHLLGPHLRVEYVYHPNSFFNQDVMHTSKLNNILHTKYCSILKYSGHQNILTPFWIQVTVTGDFDIKDMPILK